MADVELPLDGLTVLIGENGSGKSTLLEALELLRKAGLSGDFLRDRVLPAHTDLFPSNGSFEIGVDLADVGGRRYAYSFAVADFTGTPRVISEFLDDLVRERPLIHRDAGDTAYLVDEAGAKKPFKVATTALALGEVGRHFSAEMAEVAEALSGIRSYTTFDTQRDWLRAARAFERSPIRAPAQILPTAELGARGDNLVIALFALRSATEVWKRVLEDVRLGLGDDLVDIQFRPEGPGHVGAELERRRGPARLRLSALSDGQLAYLAFVVLRHLGSQTLVGFDEPETHLHPALLTRVLALFEEMAEDRPVVLATHSDRLLDALESPERSTVLCSLDDAGQTRLRRPDQAALEAWMKTYRGIGSLRSEGYTEYIFEPLAGASRP